MDFSILFLLLCIAATTIYSRSLSDDQQSTQFPLINNVHFSPKLDINSSKPSVALKRLQEQNEVAQSKNLTTEKLPAESCPEGMTLNDLWGCIKSYWQG